MCRKLTQNLKLAPDVNLEAIARSTEGLTGADLKALLYTAQLGKSTTEKYPGCGSGLNRVSGSGSRRAKMTHKSRKKLKNFMF